MGPRREGCPQTAKRAVTKGEISLTLSSEIWGGSYYCTNSLHRTTPSCNTKRAIDIPLLTVRCPASLLTTGRILRILPNSRGRDSNAVSDVTTQIFGEKNEVLASQPA